LTITNLETDKTNTKEKRSSNYLLNIHFKTNTNKNQQEDYINLRILEDKLGKVDKFVKFVSLDNVADKLNNLDNGCQTEIDNMIKAKLNS
jgi:hypothetical protein